MIEQRAQRHKRRKAQTRSCRLPEATARSGSKHPGGQGHLEAIRQRDHEAIGKLASYRSHALDRLTKKRLVMVTNLGR